MEIENKTIISAWNDDVVIVTENRHVLEQNISGLRDSKYTGWLVINSLSGEKTGVSDYYRVYCDDGVINKNTVSRIMAPTQELIYFCSDIAANMYQV